LTSIDALKRLGLWSGVGLAYYVAAWISLQLPRPDDFITPVYFPAGIALGTVLILGVRAWPGVFLGALAWGIQTTWIPDTVLQLDLWALIFNPLSVTAQALLGAWLARRLLDWPQALDTTRDILIFILLVIPVSCILNATVSVPMLWGHGLPTELGPVMTWLQWWQGDMLGSMLLIPILLVFFGQPRKLWRPRRLGLTIPLLATGLLTIVVFRQVSMVEESNLTTAFDRDTEALGHQVERRFEAHENMVEALQGFMGLGGAISREEFRAFVSAFLERQPGAQNFSYNPRVRLNEREAFEVEISEKLGYPFQIMDRVDQEAMEASATRPFYFPILYVEPMEDNRMVLGLDPTSIDVAREAISRTLISGVPVASDGFRLTQEPRDQQGVVVYAAVSGSLGQAMGAEGLVSAAFRMGDMMSTAIAEGLERDIALCLFERASDEPRMLVGEESCVGDNWEQHGLKAEQAINFANRTWTLRMHAVSGYSGAGDGWPIWTAGLAGLFLTGTLGAFLLLITGQARRVAQMVDQRTAELASATNNLKENEDALARAQGIARMGSWEVNLLDGSFYASSGLAEILGPGADKIESIKDLLEFIHHQDREAMHQALEKAETEASSLELDCRPDADDRRILHLVVESDWRAGHAWRLRGIAQDVTDARDAADKIERLAHYDELTGLPNRSLWLECTRSALASARRHKDYLAVMFMDLDEFKTINDSLGHSVGDLLLSVISERLQSTIRGEDILARLGGDEFVVLLPRIHGKSDALQVANKMMDSLAEPVAIGEHELKLSMSIGISLYPDDGDSVEVLLQHADTAMYRAKEAGRNNAKFFEPVMSEDARERLFIESGIRKGLQNREFTLHYQPQIDCNTGNTVGMESLVRWNHPTEGLLMPGRFIMAAERSGLIVPLGDWVLQESLRQQLKWAEAGFDNVSVAVNISALQFRRDAFVKRMREYLSRTGADPSKIKLEITESALMDLSQKLLDQLRELREMGLTLSLDDFGTGYSSLTYLKRLPISQIKLDRSFVMDLPEDSDDAAIAETAIAMARNLGIQVVAEGVETLAQKEFLLARGCHIMQGFLFARPMPVSEIKLDFSYLK